MRLITLERQDLDELEHHQVERQDLDEVDSLPPGRRARFDRLRIATKYRQVPSVISWLLELADASPEVWTDPIIGPEVERILGPAEDVM